MKYLSSYLFFFLFQQKLEQFNNMNWIFQQKTIQNVGNKEAHKIKNL